MAKEWVQYTKEEMDAFAVQAKAEIMPNATTWTAKDIGIWWEKWYEKAGHKRLGRIVRDIAQNAE